MTKRIPAYMPALEWFVAALLIFATLTIIYINGMLS